MTPYQTLQLDLKVTQQTWLITGVAAFIGSNLLEALLKLNQRVVGLDNFSTGHQRNLDEVQTLVTPDQWANFHFIQAALGSVPRSIEDPITTNQNNIDGFLNMLCYHPQVILAGRRISDGMAAWIAQQTVKQMINAGSCIKGAKVTVLGLTFKENCPDLPNSKVAEIVRELQDYGCEVSVHDPIAEPIEAKHEYGIELTPWEKLPQADALVAAVAHRQCLDMPLEDLLAKLKPSDVFVDVKSAYDSTTVGARGHVVWRL